jgi:O-antigen/teichoic acid export membrane protein
MLLSALLRMVALGLRFLFLIVMAKSLSPAEYISLGGLNSLVIMSIYFIGFDLYIHLSRTLNAGSLVIDEVNREVTSYLLLIGVFLLTILVLISFLNLKFYGDYLLLLLMIIVFESIIIEYIRLLVTCGNYILSNVIFFIKTSWVIYPIICSFLSMKVDLDLVIHSWLILTMVLSFFAFLGIKVKLNFTIDDFNFDFSSVLIFLRKSWIIFISSLSFLAISNVDKVFLATKDADESIREYFIISSLISVAITVIYSGVINPFYKKIVSHSGNEQYLNKIMNKITIYSMVISVSVVIIMFLMFPFIHSYFKFTTEDGYVLLSIMALNMIFTVFSLRYHYFLFAKKLDKVIAKVSFLSFLIVCLLVPIFYELMGINGVVISLTISSTFTLMSKFFYTKKYY